MTPTTHARSAGAVLHVLLMEVNAKRYDRILREAYADARRLASKISGLLQVDLYGTDDRSHVLLISQWADDSAWGKAQWDAEVQDAVVARFSSARSVHSKLYRRVVLEGESVHAASGVTEE